MVRCPACGKQHNKEKAIYQSQGNDWGESHPRIFIEESNNIPICVKCMPEIIKVSEDAPAKGSFLEYRKQKE